eukprot:g3753.t1
MAGCVVECTTARFTALEGIDTDESPILNLKSPGECCQKCQDYKGKEECIAYTFIIGKCQNQCWLKTRVMFQRFGKNSVSGSYVTETTGGKKKAKVSIFDLPKTVSTTVESLPPIMKSRIPDWVTKRIPETCGSSDAMMNMKYVALRADPLPIFNLECPGDCKKACYDHQEMSGRYSCIAYNFKYASEVTECWLYTGTGLRIFKPGYACGRSGRKGSEMGPPPTDYQKIIKLYRDLITDSTRCIGTIQDLSAIGI